MGSSNSRSGLGIPSGAKSDSRRDEEAIRTVAAAKEYDGRASLSGLKNAEEGFAGRFSNSKAFILAGSAAAAAVALTCVTGIFLSSDTDGAELACVDMV